MASIPTLPLEIRELIAINTPTQDLLNVLLVSRSWHYAFQTFLYKDILLDSFEKHNSTLVSFITHHLPGYLTQSLKLKDIKLSADELDSLMKVFPDIDRLFMDWKLWGNLDLEEYIDPKAPLSFIHPSRGLHPTIESFFKYYGSNKLRHLNIDLLNMESIDLWTILSLVPRLKTLVLHNMNHEHIVTMGYLETLHEICPHLKTLSLKCVRADPSPELLPQFEDSGPIVITPTKIENLSISSRVGASRWALWLPYFSVKYPHLRHVAFKHSGLGKDGAEVDIPESLFALFAQGCRGLKTIKWSNISIQQDQHDGFFHQGFQYLEGVEAFENFNIPDSIIHSPVAQVGSIMSTLITSLTIGQPPVNVSTTQVMKAIGHCEKLTTLTIQECFVDPEIGFGIDDILLNCKGLKTLYVKDTHILKTGSGSCLNNHPLKNLKFKRSSFTNDVFPYLSLSCPQLEHVNLLGCFQTDRRDQLFIYLPHQNLKSLQIQGLRTRNYYTGCRIRFFAFTKLAGQQIPESHSNEICFDPSFNSSWYYMSQYDVRYHPVGRKLSFQKFRNIEYADAFNRLDSWDIKGLQALVTNKTLKGWDIEAAKRNLNTPRTISLISNESWVPENIYYSGFVNIVVNSVEALSINKKAI